LAVARDLARIVSDELFRNWLAIGRQCLRIPNEPVDLVMEIRTQAVSVRLTRFSQPGASEQARRLVEIEPLKLALEEDEFFPLVSALDCALYARQSRGGGSGQDGGPGPSVSRG